MSPARLREVRQKKISTAFENFALFPHKTILENTEFGLEIQKILLRSAEKKKKKSDECLRSCWTKRV